MKFRLIPRLKPDIGFAEIFAAMNFFGTGKIEKFEIEFAKKFENKFGVMFSHGRVGLYSLFKIWALENVEIICPAYTCIVVPHAIVLSGNIPVFVDCAKDSTNMDYDGIENAITYKTRCLIVTHLFGYPMDVIKINTIIEKAEKQFGHKIYIVQDVAHSFGCRWNGELVTRFGDASIFGLNISKTITSVFGGMVISNSPEYKQKLMNFRNSAFIKKGFIKVIKRIIYLIAVWIAFHPVVYAFTNLLERNRVLDRFVKYYDDNEISFPSDWNELPCEAEAAVGLVQLKKYDKFLMTRKQYAQEYTSSLANNKNLLTYQFNNEATYSQIIALTTLKNKLFTLGYLNGIQFGEVLEYAIPFLPAYNKYRPADISFENAVYLSKNVVNLPVSNRFDSKVINKVISVLQNF
jgi:perosamine synthetase